MNAQDRQNFIGGSDVAIILGLSPWQNRNDLLREKITGVSERFFSQAMRFGQQYENTLMTADAFMNDYIIMPAPIGQDQWEIIDEIDGFQIVCHLDGIGNIGDENFLIEIKTGSASFNGVLPDYYNCQVQWYMHWGKFNRCRIVFGKRMPDGTLGNQESFWVEKQEDWFNSILPEIKSFITDIRKGEVPPKYLPAPLERAEIAEYINVVEMYEQAENFISRFREVLAQKMEEAGIKRCYMGGMCASLTADSESVSFDSVKFKKENPELAEKYQKKTMRKGGLRITKSNKGE